MTRTQRLLAAIKDEIMRNSASLDQDDRLRTLTVTVRLNEGGYPRTVLIGRENMTTLSDFAGEAIGDARHIDRDGRPDID
mgnify:CR=1 FL=1